MKKNKLYVIVAILTAIFLFSTAALCNQCGVKAEEEKTGVAEEEEEVAEEEAEEETDEGAEEEEEVAEEEAEEEEAEEEEEEKADPTIELEIYEGPTYSESDSVCYYRIKATVTGNPSPTVEFSKDDSLGAFGSKKVQVNLSDPDETCTLTATATNSEGTATNSITLSWGCEELPEEEHTVKLPPSDIACVEKDTGAHTDFILIGDSGNNKDIRGFFAFDVISLAGKEIISATLKLKDPDYTANLCDFKGGIIIAYADYLTGGLTVSDWSVVTFATHFMFGWNENPLECSSDFLRSLVQDRAGTPLKVQFAILYQDQDSDMDNIPEGRGYETGDITLTVVYTD